MNNLPFQQQTETKKVLKNAISANRALANLNGVVPIIPNSWYFENIQIKK